MTPDNGERKTIKHEMGTEIVDRFTGIIMLLEIRGRWGQCVEITHGSNQQEFNDICSSLVGISLKAVGRQSVELNLGAGVKSGIRE